MSYSSSQASSQSASSHYSNASSSSSSSYPSAIQARRGHYVGENMGLSNLKFESSGRTIGKMPKRGGISVTANHQADDVSVVPKKKT